MFFIGMSVAADLVHANAEEKPAAKVGDTVITEKQVWDQVDVYDKKKSAEDGEGFSEEDREKAFDIIRQKKIQEACLILLMKEEGKWKEKDSPEEKEKKMKEFYKAVYNKLEIKLSPEDVQKKAEKMAAGEREVYMQMAQFEDKSFAERIQKGLQYANKTTTFETIARSLLKEEAERKGLIYKPSILDLPPRWESNLAKNFPSLANKKVGELEIGEEGEDGKYYVLYIAKKLKIDPHSKKILIEAREELLSDIQDDFFKELYKKYKVVLFDHEGNPKKLPYEVSEKEG